MWLDIFTNISKIWFVHVVSGMIIPRPLQSPVYLGYYQPVKAQSHCVGEFLSLRPSLKEARVANGLLLEPHLNSNHWAGI